MSRIFRATQGPSDWRALLADPDKQWRPGYSAMAAAQSWEAGFPPEVARLLGADAELQLAVVEHKVPLPGRGYPSQCDLFALVHSGGEDMAVAVEAKVGESFGPTVEEWLGKNPGANKQERLNALLNWLGLTETQSGLRYQLLHRTAAAIAEARRFRRPVAAMVVQSFSPERANWHDFAAFGHALGMSLEPGRPERCSLPCGLALLLGWAEGDPRYLTDLTGNE